jgi:hypothetical protein
MSVAVAQRVRIFLAAQGLEKVSVRHPPYV